MAKKGEIPDAIITSPLVRAVQTADILSEALAFQGELVASRELAPGFSMAKLRRVLASYKKRKSVALVGHEPDFGEIVGALLDLGRPLPIKKGTVICLKMLRTRQKAMASLKWILFEGKRTDASA